MKRPQQVEAHSPPTSIPNTANVYPEYRQRATEAGMRGFLAKPVNTQDLFTIIDAVVKERNRFDS